MSVEDAFFCCLNMSKGVISIYETHNNTPLDYSKGEKDGKKNNDPVHMQPAFKWLRSNKVSI